MTFLGSDTTLESCDLPSLSAGASLGVHFRITPPEFYPTNLSFSVYLSQSGGKLCDMVENGIVVQMLSTGPIVYGYLHVPCSVTVHQNHGPLAQSDKLSAVDVV